MMQVLPKWMVTVSMQSGQHVIFYISDNFLSNVLRAVSAIEFVGEPEEIRIRRVPVGEPTL
jgi:hypothetical protein